MSGAVCAACRRAIDAAARTCPYCGANPATGERVDTQTLLQEIFRPKELTRSESVFEYARQRQGIVIAISVGVLFLLLVFTHQFVTRRNATEVTDAPAIPLTEIADLSKQQQQPPQPLPDLDFQYDGNPKAMRTYIVERGAVAPAPPLPAQPAPGQTQTASPQPAAKPAPGARPLTRLRHPLPTRWGEGWGEGPPPRPQPSR